MNRPENQQQLKAVLNYTIKWHMATVDEINYYDEDDLTFSSYILEELDIDNEDSDDPMDFKLVSLLFQTNCQNDLGFSPAHHEVIDEPAVFIFDEPSFFIFA
jgi:hypothetical protein